MNDSTEPAAATPVPPPRPPFRRGRHVERARGQKVNKARGWILAIAILQMLFGIGFGVMNNKEADKGLRNLEQFEATETVEVDGGEEWVVADLRAAIERERIQAFAVPIGLGVVFLVLWWWAKRAALAAMVCTFLLFLSVHAIEAAIDPATLVQGIVIKIFFIAAMIAGIKAALAQRIAEQQAAAEQAEVPASP